MKTFSTATVGPDRPGFLGWPKALGPRLALGSVDANGGHACLNRRFPYGNRGFCFRGWQFRNPTDGKYSRAKQQGDVARGPAFPGSRPANMKMPETRGAVDNTRGTTRGIVARERQGRPPSITRSGLPPTGPQRVKGARASVPVRRIGLRHRISSVIALFRGDPMFGLFRFPRRF